jgi:hypothetical protein
MMLSIKIQDYQFTLAVIYGPNNDCPSFLSKLQQNIESLGNSSVIISGFYILLQCLYIPYHTVRSC